MRLTICAILLFFIPLKPSFAALPFVTDDASIADLGQVSIESFVENWRLPKRYDEDSANLIGTYFGGSVGVTKNLELTAGGLLGHNLTTDKLNVANPIFQAKSMVFRSDNESKIPSIAASIGYADRHGRDQYFDQANNVFALGIATSRFFDGDLVIHINSGFKGSYNIDQQRNFSRLHLGIASDTAITKKVRFIAESYNGAPNSPRDSDGYFKSYQVGFRFVKSSSTSFHILYGSQPTFLGYDENNRMLYRHSNWVQIGVRKVIDDLF